MFIVDMAMQVDYKNILVAHRGDHFNAPENSIRALKIAMIAGAQFFEFDVQLSQDLQPFVVHDENLLRTVGKEVNIFNAQGKELRKLRLLAGDELQVDLLPDLKSAVELLNQDKKYTVFVEIKRQSVAKFEVQTALKSVLGVLKLARFKIVIISYKQEVVSLAREQGFKVGWVNDAFNPKIIDKANDLQVDYLFSKAVEVLKLANFKKSWKLGVYTVNDALQVDDLLKHGVDLVETDHFSHLYQFLQNG